MTRRPWRIRFSLLAVLVTVTVAAVLFAAPQWQRRFDLWALAQFSGAELTAQNRVRDKLRRLSPGTISPQTRVESIDALDDGRVLAVVHRDGQRSLILLDESGQTVWLKKWIRYFRRSAFNESGGFPCLSLRNRLNQHIYLGITGRRILPVRFEAEGRVGAVWSEDVPDGWLDELFSTDKVMNLNAMAMIPMSLAEEDKDVLLKRLEELKQSPDVWIRQSAEAAEQLILGPSFLHLDTLGYIRQSR